MSPDSNTPDPELTDTPVANIPAKKAGSFWLEFGPLIAFFGAFQYFKRSNPDDAMVWAAGILALLASLALTISWFKHKYLSPILILTTVLVVFFAGLTFLTGNKIFLFMKPTIVNTMFGIAVIGGVLFKKNIIEMLMGSAIKIPQKQWDTLAIRWGIFFFTMAVLNELIWRNFSEDFWVKFKVFGFLPLSILFTMTQVPFIMKHAEEKPK